MSDIHLNREDLDAMEGRKRAVLINQVSGIKSANLIGTIDEDANENLAIFSSVVHLGSNPALFGFVLRPTTVTRHTYENIKTTGVYTLNQVSKQLHQRAHLTSAKFPRGTSEFTACQIGSHYIDGFSAPFVAESHIKIGLRFVEEHPISNGTHLIVGHVEHLIVPDGSIGEDGFINLETLETVGVGGLDSYYSVQKLGRYGYVEPNKPLQKIS